MRVHFYATPPVRVSPIAIPTVARSAEHPLHRVPSDKRWCSRSGLLLDRIGGIAAVPFDSPRNHFPPRVAGVTVRPHTSLRNRKDGMIRLRTKHNLIALAALLVLIGVAGCSGQAANQHSSPTPSTMTMTATATVTQHESATVTRRSTVTHTVVRSPAPVTVTAAPKMSRYEAQAYCQGIADQAWPYSASRGDPTVDEMGREYTDLQRGRTAAQCMEDKGFPPNR